jgi:hypothetical protein
VPVYGTVYGGGWFGIAKSGRAWLVFGGVVVRQSSDTGNLCGKAWVSASV